MIRNNSKVKKWLKRIIIGGIILLIAASVFVWYIFTERFTDTSERKPAYIVNALDLIHEFEKNDSMANIKYAEEIIVVNGIVTEMESANTMMNLKMSDTITGSYIIFAFQKENIAETKKIKVGDAVSIKGSCSGGTYSDILEAESINFKRSVINKK